MKFDKEWMNEHQKGLKEDDDLGFSKQAKKKLLKMYPDINEEDIILFPNLIGGNPPKEVLEMHFYKDAMQGWEDKIDEFITIIPDNNKLNLEIKQIYFTTARPNGLKRFEEETKKIIPKKGLKCKLNLGEKMRISELDDQDYSYVSLDCKVIKKINKNRVNTIPKLIEQASKDLSEITIPLSTHDWT